MFCFAAAAALVLSAIVMPATAFVSHDKPDPWHPNYYVCPNCRRVYDNKGDADKCCN